MDCGLDGLTFNDPSLTKPQFAAECDLHGIIQRFMKTGQLPPASLKPAEIQDVTSLPEDFQELLDTTVAARQQFDSLPLETRNQFNNDAAAYFEAVAASLKPAEVVPPSESANVSEAASQPSEVIPPVTNDDPKE